MNGELVKYIKDVLALRKDMITTCQVEQSGEVMKIWARWIITHRSLFQQKSFFLPDDNVYDFQLVKEITDKGCSQEHGRYIHNWLWQMSKLINARYQAVADTDHGGIHGHVPITINNGVSVTLTCDELSVDLNTTLYDKMRDQWYRTNHQSRRFSNPNPYIWITMILYGMLDGKGLQWAVPPSFLQFIKHQLGCNTELFGSPINHYYDNYYSLFQLDRVFGSRGNFFTAPDSDFRSGCFQVNPPFIDSLFTKTTCRILKLLEEAEAEGAHLTFIYIMPRWSDFFTLNAVTDSRYCVRNITLYSDKHFYYEYSTESYIRAKFNTSVIILSTNDRIADGIMDTHVYNHFRKY